MIIEVKRDRFRRLRDRPTIDMWMRRTFQTAAFVEAATWVGLLFGMYFKYIAQSTEFGVQLFGSLHGGAFIFYLASAVAAALWFRWSGLVLFLTLIAAVPPLLTLVAERWLLRRGALSSRHANATEDVGGG